MKYELLVLFLRLVELYPWNMKYWVYFWDWCLLPWCLNYFNIYFWHQFAYLWDVNCWVYFWHWSSSACETCTNVDLISDTDLGVHVINLYNMISQWQMYGYYFHILTFQWKESCGFHGIIHVCLLLTLITALWSCSSKPFSFSSSFFFFF